MSWATTGLCERFPVLKVRSLEPLRYGLHSLYRNIYPHQTACTQRWSRLFRQYPRLPAWISNIFRSRRRVIPILF